MTRNQLIVLAVAVVVVALVALLIIRRVRYVRAIKGRGWTINSSPTLDLVMDHLAPPFGLGFTRTPDDLISGTTSAGWSFRVFEYACSGGGARFSERLASISLPFPLPDAFIGQGVQRPGVPWPAATTGGIPLSTGDPAYAAVLTGSVLPAVGSFGQLTGAVDLSIDGNHVVAVGAPRDPEKLGSYLEALVHVAQAAATPALQPYAIAAPVPHVGFYGRPDWVLVGRDDALIDAYGLTRVGYDHTTKDVIRAANDGLPFHAFEHTWKTDRTETTTDANGNTTTHTVTENHSDTVLVITMPFALPFLSLNAGWGGERVRFESEDFNGAFAVRTDNAKFASDVIHPRTMEYLLAMRPPGFRIEGQLMRFSPGTHDSLLVGHCADVAHGLLGRVPTFVWKDLGIHPPAFRV